MSRTKRVEVHEFAFELPDLGFDAGGFNMVYQAGNRLKLSKYAIVIEADYGMGYRAFKMHGWCSEMRKCRGRA